MGKIAVLDTETNWADQVMSIGTVIADADTLEVTDSKYHILPAECEIGGMYYDAVFSPTPVTPIYGSRQEILEDLRRWLVEHKVQALFAYNASFDRNHLPELRNYQWFDIMRMAAYRQTNPQIPANADCCSTGRLKRGYGVEAMLRLMSGRSSYYETHNAYFDALDELHIMRLLGHPVEKYIPLGP